VCIWDKDLRLVTWNAAYRTIAGIPDNVLRAGMRLSEVLDHNTALSNDDRTSEELEAGARKQLAVRGTLEIDRVLVDGRTIAVNYHPFATGGWIAFYHDVTERRRDVARLRESERELKLQNARIDAALTSMPYGFSIWNDDFRLILSNRRYAEIYGMPPERIHIGMTLLDVSELTVAAGNHPGVAPDELFRSYRDRMLATMEPAIVTRFEKRIRGRTIRSSYTRSPGLGWIVTHEDITEDIARVDALRTRETELRRQNMRLDAAVNNMSQGLSMFDADQRLVICNGNYASLYNLPAEMVRPGTTLESILAHQVDSGMYPIGGKDAYVALLTEMVARRAPTSETFEMRSGRVVSVMHHPMPDGGWVATHHDITDQRRSEARIRHLARHDALTDLPNRLMFGESMSAAEGRIRRRETVGVLAIDLDHFKSVNDTLGHTVGDTILTMVADRLRNSCRDGDLVARLGGDEFAILTGALEHPRDAAALAERIVRTMAEPFDGSDHNVLIGASVGIAVAPGDGLNGESLLRNADLALYRAKRDGRGAYHFFEPGMDAALQERRALELGLRQALALDQLRLVFQPLFNLRERRICALEALLRWDHPERGTIAPADFIPIAEDSGLIVAIGEWVLRRACAVAVTWPGDVHLAVNLSTVQFRNPGLVDQVKAALDDSGLQAGRLEIEVTESLLLLDGDSTLGTLYRLSQLGVTISMDDFGTGYSSLSYLRSFPFDKIKIDQSFIRDLAGKEDSRAIVNAVIGLGRSLGMSTTAEGVETEAQLDAVREQGCTEVQGFLFSPPLPEAAVARLFGDAAGMAEWTRALTAR
jgi:diguanylate cyclase (GGDEF)-like protein